MSGNEVRSRDSLVARCNELEAEVLRLRAEVAQYEMWTCPVCDCTIRKVQMELSDGTPAPCPECGRVAAEMDVDRLTRENATLRRTIQDADVTLSVLCARFRGMHRQIRAGMSVLAGNYRDALRVHDVAERLRKEASEAAKGA